MAGKSQKKSSRKAGREKAKRLRKNSPTSLYSKGKISFEQYVKLTNKGGKSPPFF